MSAGCGTDDVVAPVGNAADIVASAVSPNPNNVISAIVVVEVQRADSVAVRYRIAGDTLDQTTAAFAATDSTTVIPVLGLVPDTSYLLQALAWGGGELTGGRTLAFATGTLPGDLPQYIAGGENPSPGYVAFAAGPYGIVIDNAGRVVWYHRFEPLGPGLNFQAQPTGRYVARPPPVSPSVPAPWIEIDPLGAVTRTLFCANGLQSRFHDLLLESDGSYWILCDESRVMDLSARGGDPGALVTGTVVQHVGGTGELLFHWSAFDHFDITDLDLAERTGPIVNWTHANALDLDADGNLVVSFRSLSEITKIDTRTGQVIWRMGGRRNQFTFMGAAVPAFARQHGVRMTGTADMLLFDNFGDPAGSTAERYIIDAAARRARLVSSYAATPAVTAQLGGTTQNLANGRVLVSFGSGARVEEYDASGTVVWRIEHPGYVFRAQRILSLYHPIPVSSR
jgi:hypothetical protein